MGYYYSLYLIQTVIMMIMIMTVVMIMIKRRRKGIAIVDSCIPPMYVAHDSSGAPLIATYLLRKRLAKEAE